MMSSTQTATAGRCSRPRSNSAASSVDGGTATASVQQLAAPLTHPATPGAAFSVAGAMSDADFKDAILYAQDQQRQQFTDLSATMRALLQRLDAANYYGAGGGRNATAASDETPAGGAPLRWSLSGTSGAPVGEGLAPAVVMPGPFGAAYTIQQLLRASESLVLGDDGGGGRGSGADFLRDAELEAARCRIAALERQVQSLQQQLESKERAIQRLAAAATDAVAHRIAAVAAPTTGGGGFGGGCTTTPARAARGDEHTDAVEGILRASAARRALLFGNGGPSGGASPLAVASAGATTRLAAAYPPEPEEVSELLRQHQARCRVLTQRGK